MNHWKPVSGREVRFLLCVLLVLLLVGCNTAATPEPAAPAGASPESTEPESAEPESAEPESAEPESAEPESESAVGAQPGGEIVIGYAEDTQSFDPHASQVRTTARIMGNVCEPLIVRGPDSEFYPSLAESWEISPEGTTYTFTLKQGVTFHDGTPFNAEAVKFNLDRIIDPANALLASELLGPYSATEVVDDYTVNIQLTEPFAPLMDGLSKVYTCMVSPAAVEEWGVDFGLHVVGTGPYIAEEIVNQDHVTLVKNPDYNWAPPFYNHQGPAYLDRITFRFVPEEGTRVATLETGEIDIADGVGAQSVAIIEGNPNLAIGKANYSGTPRTLWLNTQQPPLDNPAVRRALNHAINKQEIVDVLYAGIYEVATAPLTKTTWSYNPNVDMYAYDPALVEQIMTEDGWVKNAEGIWEKDGEPLHLLFLNISGYRLDELAQMVQGQLLSAGFDVEVQALAVGAWLEEVEAGNHGIAPTMGDATDPTILRSMFSETMLATSLNRSKVQGNTELENLLLAQDAESDPEARRELLLQVQQIIMEEAYTVPLYDSVEVYGYDARLQDLTFDAATHPRLYDVWLQP